MESLQGSVRGLAESDEDLYSTGDTWNVEQVE